MLKTFAHRLQPFYQYEATCYHTFPSENNELDLILKISLVAVDDRQLRQKWQAECDRVARLKKAYFPRPLSVEDSAYGPALVFEKGQRKPLMAAFPGGVAEPGNLLKLCLQMVDLHAYLEQQKLPRFGHGPGELFIDWSTQQLCLLGISQRQAVRLDHDQQVDLQQLMDMLPYLSPEHQSGLHALSASDVDLYALGVAFYRLASGRFPFMGQTAAELCHQHMAIKPDALLALRPDLPQAFSDVVDKLLAKDLDHRYRTLTGLQEDVAQCLSLNLSNPTQSMVLGQYERPVLAEPSGYLYGRQDEVALIHNLCQQVATGETRVMTIKGFSGIGKSSLAKVADGIISARHGLMIRGKFDQNGSAKPYASIIEAFTEWANRILSSEQKVLETWRERLNEKLIPNGRVITDVIPELEIVMGPQAQIPVLPPGETQNRFFRVFQDFLVLTCTETPLILFLDDMQWMDPASIELLQHLLGSKKRRRFLVILSYRDNEVSAGHPLYSLLRHLQEKGISNHPVHLTNLDQQTVHKLIADRLQTDPSQVDDLCRFVFGKTEGNPFFTLQLVRTLLDEHILFFNASQQSWQWHQDRLEKFDYANNVVDLMIARISHLSEPVQHMMMTAACIGNHFDWGTLHAVCPHTHDQLKAALREAIDAGLVQAAGGTHIGANHLDWNQADHFRFAHDRIQQAASSMESEVDKRQLHLKIGQYWRDNLTDDKRKERLFEMVDQINRGRELLTLASDRVELAQWNGKASRKAQDTNAFESSLTYAQIGLGLLPERAWQQHYQLACELSLAQVRILLLLNRREQTEQLVPALLQNCRSLSDRILVREALISHRITQGQFLEAIAQTRQIIEELDITLLEDMPPQAPPCSLKPGEDADCLTFEQLEALPTIENKNIELAMEIMVGILPSTFLVEPKLFSQLAFTLVDLAIRYGNSEASASGFAVFGMALRRMHPEKIAASYQYGNLALRLLDRYPVRSCGTVVHGACNIMLRHWCEPAINCWHALLKSSQVSFNLGNYEHGIYNMTFAGSYGLFLGFPLQDNLKHAEKSIQLTKETMTEINVGYAQVQHAVFTDLIHGPKPGFVIQGTYFDESVDPAKCLAIDQPNAVCQMWIGKMLLAYFFGQPQRAHYFLEQSRKYFEPFDLMIEAWQLVFYEAMIALALVDQDAEQATQAQLAKARACLQQLRQWCAFSPQNLTNKCVLIEAEIARVTDQTKAAMAAYDQAIELAKENRYLHEMGLSCERAAYFYNKIGSQRIAVMYAKEAAHAYRDWGAHAKAIQLEASFAIRTRLLRATSTPDEDLHLQEPSFRGLTLIDILAVIQASQTISSEVVLEPLLEKFLTIAVRNAGAQKGVIILAENEALDLDHMISAPQVLDPSLRPQVATSVVRYVERTRNDVLLDDASEDTRFRRDPYVLECKPKSILCFALTHKDSFLGVLYLENNLLAGGFTQTRVEVLRLLMVQAAISIDNASLYRNMEGMIAARTHELQEAQDQLIQSGKMAAIGELATSVAHELNQPLSFIRGGAQLEIMNLDKDTMDQKSARETLEQIVMGTDRMMRIISHLREFSRTSDSKIQLPIHIHGVLANSLLMTTQQFKNHNIEVISQIAADDLSVLGQEHQLEQVFINILCNARDALKQVERPRLTISTSWQASGDAVDSVEICFADNGTGMSQKTLSQIFDPFFTTKDVGEGTGIGLAISQRIVEEHGGTIEVKSKQGEGTQFCVRLPSLIGSSQACVEVVSDLQART